MKITLTYGSGQQTGPDTFESWTEVVHIKETDTIAEVYEKHFKGKWHGTVNVELHIQPNDD